MSTFKDHFSTQADLYAKFRPHYPEELYAFLSSLTAEHNLAWDCGTGNGQAAIGLAKFFDRVIATDPSEQQIRLAVQNDKVEYKVEKAEHTSLRSASVDLATIANALHWFNFEIFYDEVRRVLKPNGIIAAWAYQLPVITPEVDRIVEEFHYQTLNDYWLAENRLVEKGYATIPFPFEIIASPDFAFKKEMKLDEFIGYLNTWSATQRYIKQNGVNPTETLREKLHKVWNHDQPKLVTWHLILKAGRAFSR